MFVLMCKRMVAFLFLSISSYIYNLTFFPYFRSAGVGRTGVLIAVEMAMNMIEALEPIDLMEITRKMRNQRGMMIQSPVGRHGRGRAGERVVVECDVGLCDSVPSALCNQLQ